MIQLHAISTKEEPIYIVIELMKHGSLLEYLRGDGHLLKLPQLIDMGAHVAADMAYLEEKNCIHQDLAAETILVAENLICKVAGFGLACFISKEVYEVPTGIKLRIKWTALETILHGYYTSKCDVWSFGVLLYELITYGCRPYPAMNNTEVVDALQKRYRMPCPNGCPDKLYALMRKCWKEEASSRPTFKALSHRLKKFLTKHLGSSHDQVNHKPCA